MPSVELCMVCGIRLRVDRRRHTRYCRSTCRVRAMRARQRGVDVRTLRTRYMALRAQAVSLSWPGSDPIASVPLRPLAKVLQHAESLAAQLAVQTQRAADLSARLALADKATLQERAAHERTRVLLASARAAHASVQANLSEAHTAHRQTHKQLMQAQKERDQARTPKRKRKVARKPPQKIPTRAEQARDAEQQASTALRLIPSTPLIAKLVNAPHVDRERQAPAAPQDKELARVRTMAVEAQRTDNKSAAHKYDPAGDWLVWYKSQEIKERDELESWADGTGRLRPQRKTLDQRAFEAAMAARYTLLTQPPKGYRKPVSWSIPERALDAASEKYLCDESCKRFAEIFLKLPHAARLKNR